MGRFKPPIRGSGGWKNLPLAVTGAGRNPREMQKHVQSLDDLFVKRCALAGKLKKGDTIDQYGAIGRVDSIVDDKVYCTVGLMRNKPVSPEVLKKKVGDKFIPLDQI